MPLPWGRGIGRSLHIQHFGQTVEDLGIVVIAAKYLGIHTLSQHGNRQAGMAVGGEADAGLIVQDVGQRHGQGIVGSVHHILSLSVSTSLSTVDALLESDPQLLQLIGRQNQLVALRTLGFQTKQSLNVTIPEDLDYTGIFDDLMQAYTTAHELVRVKTTNMGSMFRLTYRITLREAKLEKSLIDSIRCRNGNLEITVSNQETAGSEL